MKKMLGFAALLFASLSSSAQSAVDEKYLAACPFSKGDSITKVKAFYMAEREPSRMNTAVPGQVSYQYHFPEYGVWVFLDASLQVSTLRFESSFKGPIGGVSVGTLKDDVKRIKGEPVRTFQGFPDTEDTKLRNTKKQQALDALPDPVPKLKVREFVEELTRTDTAPFVWNSAWSYATAVTANWVRYDLSPTTNAVSIILAGSCNP
ncbi:MAG: hypothetical protein RIS34_806 [Pseudomonadota bacterium]|jgi:hypothetical protein